MIKVTMFGEHLRVYVCKKRPRWAMPDSIGSFVVRGEQPCIWVCSRYPVDEQRHILRHEIGHMIGWLFDNCRLNGSEWHTEAFGNLMADSIEAIEKLINRISKEDEA